MFRIFVATKAFVRAGSNMTRISRYLVDKFPKHFISEKITVESEIFNELPEVKQTEMVLNLLPKSKRDKYEIETRRVYTEDETKIYKPSVRKLELAETMDNLPKVPISPQSLLDRSVWFYERGQAALAGEMAWLSSSLQLRLYLGNYGLAADSHYLKNNFVDFLCEFYHNEILKITWDHLQSAHSTGYTDKEDMSTVIGFLKSSKLFSNSIYELLMNKTFKFDDLKYFAQQKKASYNKFKKLKILKPGSTEDNKVYISFHNLCREDIFPSESPTDYFCYLLNKIGQDVDVNSFRFLLVKRHKDTLSGTFKYMTKEENILSLPVSFEECNDSPIRVGPFDRKIIDLSSCLTEAFSEKIKGKGRYDMKLGSFPDVLTIKIPCSTQNKKAKKEDIDLDVDFHDNIDLSLFYSEVKMKNVEDEHTTNDKDKHELKQEELSSEEKEKIALLSNYGFTNFQSIFALKKVNWDTNWALLCLESFSDEIPEQSTEDSAIKFPSPKELQDGCGKYTICAIIYHLGGVLVANLKRNDGVWCRFIDYEVTFSDKPISENCQYIIYKKI